MTTGVLTPSRIVTVPPLKAAEGFARWIVTFVPVMFALKLALSDCTE
jgi:hypothetical protein